ncbi:hypothetical protein GLAREA_12990 [Glarea lozoyensis ATCC 20868]|uniref:Uncharacterized protein n=1 Tax=Glarea lozoyensis (strain ATCC 20868 / MF5171) TaxID=1116229 RepID=S3CV46_GLAL2|nr:uncharacterized protein GLAREA_12990 [Glarea lozoyensis ATCC 20868]EPE30267.1 hypothetical protein GLAREA_12990 [Glarea lozoyensis ATCC 20868]
MATQAPAPVGYIPPAKPSVLKSDVPSKPPQSQEQGHAPPKEKKKGGCVQWLLCCTTCGAA